VTSKTSEKIRKSRDKAGRKKNSKSIYRTKRRTASQSRVAAQHSASEAAAK
jgi:hypothetical protein